MNSPSMDEERKVFDEAVALAAGDRDAFLMERCGDDAGFAARIRNLLDAHEQSDTASDPLEHEAIKIAAASAPEMIDSYRLLERIGEGGMGVVYLADQCRPVRRRVALKLMRSGIDSKEVVARFLAERQALALMNHANIARILDGGTYEGRPYFVMEYVPGVPLTEYCDRRKLSIEDRLRLFERVCIAVHHAHQKGIIHRDLKPTNILVAEEDGEPTPKIIDFGIAKAVSQRLVDVTLHTQMGRLIGTPAYMSPEQAETTSLDIDTRTDVYSLGAILYELLVGQRVFEVDDPNIGLVQAQRIIVEQEPIRPSVLFGRMGPQALACAEARSTDPDSLERQLRDDLDWIVLTALEKDRSRRYASASEFATDLRRFLEGEPVAARPPSLVYRTKKLWNRHKIATSAAAISVVAMIAAAILSTSFGISAVRSSNSAARAREQAEAQRQLAELQSYVANIVAANGAIHSVDMSSARLRLDAAPDSLRGWEWRHLNSLIQREYAIGTGSVGKAWICDLSSDGVLFASTWGGDLTIRILDVETGQELTVGRLHASSMTSIAFGPGDRDLFGVDDEGPIIQWRVTDLSLVRRFSIESESATSVQLSPDGSRLFSSGTDGRVRAWSPSTGELLASSASVGTRLSHLVVSPDGSRLAAGGWDQRIRTWNAQSFELMLDQYCKLESTPVEEATAFPRGQITTLGFSVDSAHLAVGTRDGVLRIFETSGGALVDSPVTNGSVIRTVTFSPDGAWLAAGDGEGRTWIWSWPDLGEPRILRKHAAAVSNVAFSPDSTTLVSTSFDNSVRMWNVQSGRLVTTFVGHSHRIYGVRMVPDRLRFVTWSEDNTIRFWEPRAETLDVIAFRPWWVFSLIYSEKLGAVLNASPGHSIEAAFITEIKPPRIIGADLITGGNLAIHESTDRLAVSRVDHSIVVFDLASKRVIAEMVGHELKAHRLLFAPDGDRLISVSADQTIRVWDASTGRNISTSTKQGAAVMDAVLAPGGQSFFTASHMGDLIEWDVQSGEHLRTVLRGQYGPLNRLAFSNDGRQLAVGGMDRQVRVFDTTTWNLVTTLSGHNDTVTALCWLPDDTRLLSGSRDRTIRVWNPSTDSNVRLQKEIVALRGHDAVVWEIIATPDGERVFSSSEDGTVRQWYAPE